MPKPSPLWAGALRVAALAAADPHGCGGVVVRAGAGPVRERWLAALRAALPDDAPWARLPAGIADDRLIGGLDLAATLRAGRPVAQSGLLAQAHGGVAVVPMAERLAPGLVARLAAVLDTGTVALERDGSSARLPARVGLILLDEGRDDEGVAEALADRIAFRLDLTGLGWGDLGEAARSLFPYSDPRPHPEVPRGGLEGGLQNPTRVAEPSLDARLRLAPQDEGRGGDEPGEGTIPDPVAALCAVADDLGVASLRGPLLAARVARLAAAGAGRIAPTQADVIEAARLVLAPRATRLPAAPPPDEARGDPEPQEAPPDGSSPEDAPDGTPPPEPSGPDPDDDRQDASGGEVRDTVLEAARAAIPQNLLAQLMAGGPRLRDGRAGRAGAATSAPRTGRPVGNRPGDPRRGRLDLIATLRAAAPWQRLRQGGGETRRIVVRPDDLRIKQLRQKTETTTVFCVDASGSAALERLAEAKGAVELLLAEAYVRRDRVALIAFRGRGAEILLPPTRSLVRAKRALAGLPGGGGTPLAAGLDAAAALALTVRRGGGSPVVVVLTDGRANVARSGEGGRALAGEEALAAAWHLRAIGLAVLVIDTGARPDGARRLAEAAQARYCPMPYADAGALRSAVRAATA